MYKYLLFVNKFSPNKDYLKNLIKEFNLDLHFKNNRTTILSNDNFSISIDDKISRVQIFDQQDYKTIKSIKEYFRNAEEDYG